MSKQELKSTAPIDNFATGLIRDDKGELMVGGDGLAFEYLAPYGKQSLNDDQLGIAVIFPGNQKLEITKDEFSHIIILQPQEQAVTYYFLAAWEQEMDGIKDKFLQKIFG